MAAGTCGWHAAKLACCQALPSAACRASQVIGPLAQQTELLLGNYYGNPAGRLMSPYEAMQVGPAVLQAARRPG